MNFIQANRQQRVYGSTRAQLDDDTINSPKRRVMQAGDSVTATASSKTSRTSASTVVAQPRQQQGGDDDDCPSGRDYSYRHGRLHPLLSILHLTSSCQRMYKCSSFAMTGSLACSIQPQQVEGTALPARQLMAAARATADIRIVDSSGKILMTSPAWRPSDTKVPPSTWTATAKPVILV